MADGGTPESVREDDYYMISHYGPNLGSLTNQWRIKPTKLEYRIKELEEALGEFWDDYLRKVLGR